MDKKHLLILAAQFIYNMCIAWLFRWKYMYRMGWGEEEELEVNTHYYCIPPPICNSYPREFVNCPDDLLISLHHLE